MSFLPTTECHCRHEAADRSSFTNCDYDVNPVEYLGGEKGQTDPERERD